MKLFERIKLNNGGVRWYSSEYNEYTHKKKERRNMGGIWRFDRVDFDFVEYLFIKSDLKNQIKKFELVDENDIVILRFEFNPFKLNLGVKECFLSYKNNDIINQLLKEKNK